MPIGQRRERDWWRSQLATRLGVPFTDGNRVDLLCNGREIFPAMLSAIRQAESNVDLLSFAWRRGEIADEFARVLAQRARAGVTVRVVLDGFGAEDADRASLSRMEEAGVHLRLFRRSPRWRFWELNHRCHRRVLVCDGRVGFTGGVGIAEEWTGDGRTTGSWRDTHVRIRGPAVAGLHGAFFDTWSEVAALDGGTATPQHACEGDTPVQVIRGSGAVSHNDVADLFRLLFRLAGRRLRISTAYFVPDEAFGDLLCDAARRGVAVDVLAPGPNVDKRVGRLAGEKEYASLLEAGGRIHHYEPSMFHAKTVTVDGQVAVVGTANLNARSMGLDQEVEAVVLDDEIVASLDRIFERDLRHSHLAEPPTGLRRVVSEATNLIDDAI